MTEGFEKIKRSTLTEGVTSRIKEMIEKNNIRPGEKFPAERELAGMFGVGRSSVREALQVLHALGAVDRKQGIGTYLNRDAAQRLKKIGTAPEKYTVMELVQARKIFEVQTAELAALNAGKEDILAIKTAYDKHAELSHSKLSAEITALDYNFHRAVVEGAHNSFLLKMFDILRDHLISSNYAVLTKDKVDISLTYHKQIFQAIKAHDPQKAKAVMEEHLSQVEKYIIASYE
jgi:GntR family transcriptional repressor for pyruvate dehydrogenase complex